MIDLDDTSPTILDLYEVDIDVALEGSDRSEITLSIRAEDASMAKKIAEVRITSDYSDARIIRVRGT